jgi:hypothetical protein
MNYSEFIGRQRSSGPLRRRPCTRRGAVRSGTCGAPEPTVAARSEPPMRPEVVEQPLARRRRVVEYGGTRIVPMCHDGIRRPADSSSDRAACCQVRCVVACRRVIAEQHVVLRLVPSPHARRIRPPGRPGHAGRCRGIASPGTGAEAATACLTLPTGHLPGGRVSERPGLPARKRVVTRRWLLDQRPDDDRDGQHE